MAQVARAAVVFACLLAGCMQAIEEQTKPTGSIIGKKTQKIGKFDPAAGAKVRQSQVKVDSVVLGAAQAYRPMIEQVAKLEIQHAINLFHALEGRYPKDYDEFMKRIIKENGIQLPELGEKYEYQYDEKNHALVIVEKSPPAGGP